MPFDFHCPWCGKKLQAIDRHVGTTTTCPPCGRAIEVPDPQQTVTPAPRANRAAPSAGRPLEFHCPWCGRKLRGNTARCGAALRCPSCKGVLVVPGVASSPETCGLILLDEPSRVAEGIAAGEAADDAPEGILIDPDADRPQPTGAAAAAPRAATRRSHAIALGRAPSRPARSRGPEWSPDPALLNELRRYQKMSGAAATYPGLLRPSMVRYFDSSPAATGPWRPW